MKVRSETILILEKYFERYSSLNSVPKYSLKTHILLQKILKELKGGKEI